MAAFTVQHIDEKDKGNTGGTETITTLSSLDNAIEFANSNHFGHAGPPATGGNQEGDDMSGGIQLTDTSTLTYYRASGSTTNTCRFHSSVLEYTGSAGGTNEILIRGRGSLTCNGTTTSNTATISGISDIDKLVPFITGIVHNGTSDDGDSGTACAWMSGTDTLNVEKGSTSNNVTIYYVVAEFTGSNWNVYHADSGNGQTGDTGTVTLREASDGSGATTPAVTWANTLIIGQFRADHSAGVNDGLADLCCIYNPNATTTVDWTFNSAHVSSDNRHFVHVIENSEWTVDRFTSTANAAGYSNIDITSAGLTGLDEALIVGFTNASGTGVAYGRGWRNYHLNTTTQARHYCHRSGNTLSHEIQVVDLNGMSEGSSAIEITGVAASIAVETSQATVQADVDIAITGTAASVAYQATAATVQSNVDIDITGTAASVAYQADQSTVQSDVDIAVTGTAASVAYEATPATVQANVDIDLTGIAASVAYQTTQATVDLASAIEITGVAASVVYEATAATVQADVDIGISGTAASVAYQADQASVQADVDINLSATAASVAYQADQATVQSDVDIAITGTAASVAYQADQAAVQANVDVDLTGVTANYVYEATAANVQSDVDIAVVASEANYVYQADQATVQSDVDISITGTAASVAYQSDTASVTVGVSIPATAASVVYEATAATVQSDVDINIVATAASVAYQATASAVQANVDIDITSTAASVVYQATQATVELNIVTNITGVTAYYVYSSTQASVTVATNITGVSSSIVYETGLANLPVRTSVPPRCFVTSQKEATTATEIKRLI